MFTTTTADILHGALLDAKNIKVTPFKKPASPRCLFEFPDTEEARALIRAYEQRKEVPVPHKDFISSYRKLLAICKELQAGRLGGA